METFFLACFLFGALFTLASVVLGFVGAGGDGSGADAGSFGDGADLQGTDAGHHHFGSLSHALPILNFSSLLGFVTSFGAVGYLLLRFAAWPLVAVLAGAVVAGLAGAVVIALFLRLALSGEHVLDPREYQLEGTIARVTVTIPTDGVGEIIFTKAGTRRSEAARSVSDGAISRDTEVVVIAYERGIALVQAWDEFVAHGELNASRRGDRLLGGSTPGEEHRA